MVTRASAIAASIVRSHSDRNFVDGFGRPGAATFFGDGVIVSFSRFITCLRMIRCRLPLAIGTSDGIDKVS